MHKIAINFILSSVVKLFGLFRFSVGFVMFKRLLISLVVFLLTLLEIALKLVFLILWPILFVAERIELSGSPVDPKEEDRIFWIVHRHNIF